MARGMRIWGLGGVGVEVGGVGVEVGGLGGVQLEVAEAEDMEHTDERARFGEERTGKASR